MVGLSFVLQDLETGRVVAHALLCPDAQYASVLHHAESRIERPQATAFQWLSVQEQLTRRIDSGPLHRASPIVALLLEDDVRSAITVQHLVSTPLDVEPHATAATLDALLLEFSATPAHVVDLSQFE